MWLENPAAVATVDLANAAYGLMLRLLAYTYGLRGPSAEKSLAVDLAIGLMRAVLPLAERAARLPAGPSNPHCNAGMSFIALRDAGALAPGRGGAAAVRRALRAAGRRRRRRSRRRAMRARAAAAEQLAALAGARHAASTSAAGGAARAPERRAPPAPAARAAPAPLRLRATASRRSPASSST